MLDRQLAEKGQYPAINVLKSVSRVMNSIVDEDHLKHATELRRLLSVYEEHSELIQIGAYKRGTDKDIDLAIDFNPTIIDFLKQDVTESDSFNEAINKMNQVLLGGAQ